MLNIKDSSKSKINISANNKEDVNSNTIDRLLKEYHISSKLFSKQKNNTKRLYEFKIRA